MLQTWSEDLLSSQDCPRSLAEQVVCKIEVTSNLGNTVIINLPFDAQMLGAGIYYWSSATGILVTFPSLDGGLDASAPDATADRQSEP